MAGRSPFRGCQTTRCLRLRGTPIKNVTATERICLQLTARRDRMRRVEADATEQRRIAMHAQGNALQPIRDTQEATGPGLKTPKGN